MVPQKDPASPCGWHSRPWFVLLLKPNVRTSPQRHSARLQSRFSHCNTDTNDYIKAVSSILTHRLLSQRLHTEGSWLLARDYTVVSNHNSGVRGTARPLQNSICAILQLGAAEKTLTAACSCVHSDFTTRALHSGGILMISGALRKAHAVLGCHAKCSGCSWDLGYVLCTPITGPSGRKVGF